jgi:hypothetical protein
MKIGYWYSAAEPTLPMPIPTDTPVGREFLNKLDYIINTPLEYVDIVEYLGYSRCRLCGKPNGTSDVCMPQYTFPDGLLHYYRDHGVAPTPDFVEYIMKFNCIPVDKPDISYMSYMSNLFSVFDVTGGLRYTS